MKRNWLVVFLTTVLFCESAGAAPVKPPTTAQYLRWLNEVQSPVDARHYLRRKYPEVKFNGDGFSDCVDFLRDAAVPNLLFDANAIRGIGVSESTPITFRKLNTPAADLVQLVVDQADPIRHRIRYAVQNEFVLISTAEGVRRLNDFERRYRPPSHDFHNVLNRRILIEGDPSDMFDDMGGPNASMRFDDTELVAAVDATSKRVNVPINVDWKEIEAARFKPGSKISLRFANLTTFDALTLELEQVYDLDQIKISGGPREIDITLATAPASRP